MNILKYNSLTKQDNNRTTNSRISKFLLCGQQSSSTVSYHYSLCYDFLSHFFLYITFKCWLSDYFSCCKYDYDDINRPLNSKTGRNMDRPHHTKNPIVYAASTEEEKKIAMSKLYCFEYKNRGTCARGEGCWYIHATEGKCGRT